MRSGDSSSCDCRQPCISAQTEKSGYAGELYSSPVMSSEQGNVEAGGQSQILPIAPGSIVDLSKFTTRFYVDE
jgi:hypothetical protein